METNQSPASRFLHMLQQQIDELIVQLKLGKAEASDHVEQAKAALRDKLTGVQETLSHSVAHRSVAAKLDHLRLQLALGGMESRDAYHAQREKIHHAIEDVRSELVHLEDRVREDLHESADTLQLKLNALALNLGVAAIVAEDDLKTRREEFAAQAERISGKVKSALSAAGSEAESLGHEAREAFDDIRDNLRRLFH